jgi:hypothetical protein
MLYCRQSSLDWACCPVGGYFGDVMDCSITKLSNVPGLTSLRVAVRHVTQWIAGTVLCVQDRRREREEKKTMDWLDYEVGTSVKSSCLR